MMNQTDYYKILQVDPAAEPEVIVAAYKRLAQKYHPDARPGSTETRQIQEINAAFEVLSNPQKRAEYDRMRSAPAALTIQVPPDERLQTAAGSTVRTSAAQTEQRQPTPSADRRWTARRIVMAFVGMVILLAVGTAGVLIEPRVEGPRSASNGIWEGECQAPTGHRYTCRVRIKVSPSNRVTGSIIWTLMVSPRADEQLAIGRQARAYVKGTFDPASRRITIGTYTQDDPYGLIDVNEYLLLLSADGQTLSGETYDDGVLYGTLVANRKA